MIIATPEPVYRPSACVRAYGLPARRIDIAFCPECPNDLVNITEVLERLRNALGKVRCNTALCYTKLVSAIADERASITRAWHLPVLGAFTP